ncbi:MAG: WbqC family protein, partial [Rhodothermales bacterium]
APFFEFYEPELKWIFEHDWKFLGDLTCATVEALCALLEIDTPIVRSADLQGRPSALGQIMETEGRNDLLSPREVARFDAETVVPVAVLEFGELEYRQNFEGFEPGMSVLDLLFNYGPETMPLIRRAATISNFFTSGTAAGSTSVFSS